MVRLALPKLVDEMPQTHIDESDAVLDAQAC